MPEEHRHVERAVTLPVDREEAWEALTEPALLSEWLAEDVELDPREGGEAVFRYRDCEERRGTVEELIEGERLSVRWSRGDEAESLVEFILEEAIGGTRLLVVESAPSGGPLALVAISDDRLLALETLAICRCSAAADIVSGAAVIGSTAGASPVSAGPARVLVG